MPCYPIIVFAQMRSLICGQSSGYISWWLRHLNATEGLGSARVIEIWSMLRQVSSIDAEAELSRQVQEVEVVPADAAACCAEWFVAVYAEPMCEDRECNSMTSVEHGRLPGTDDHSRQA